MLIASLICFPWAFSVIFRLCIFREGLTLQKLKLISSILKIPTYPFYMILSIGLGILCLALVVLIVKSITKALNK